MQKKRNRIEELSMKTEQLINDNEKKKTQLNQALIKIDELH